MLADTGVPCTPFSRGARHGHRADVAVANSPVQPQRHGLVHRHGRQVGRPERVLSLLNDEAVVARAELLVGVRPDALVPELHPVVGETRRDVDVAAPNARAFAVVRAPGVVAVGHTAGVEAVPVAATRPAVCVHEGVAAEDEELVVGVGDAVNTGRIELYSAVRQADAITGGVVALPRHRQPHPRLRMRHHGQAEHLDPGVRQHRREAAAAVLGAADLEAW